MGCPSCGAENTAAAKFCEECGTRLPRRCPSCGHKVGATARFCLECGQRLDAAPQAAAALSQPVTPSPETYTPRHLAERILSARTDLEGERKHVTVLFADLKGSTELIEGLDPEAAQALLGPAVSAMVEAVHRFAGTVCRVTGDGIMALFGAPLAHEDHAARACYAALTMQDAIGRYGERVREHDGVEIVARVGLNSGEVVVGSVSNDLHVEYSAIGPSVHLAARMEQLAREGTIRLTAETLRLAEGLVVVRALGRIPVKGVTEPVEAFELVGAGPTRRRFQAAAVRGLTPFVGRRAELEALQRALDLARDGHGQVVAPVGEPGAGKSRLFYEFVHSQRTTGWTILESGSVSYGKATLWLPVIDLLKAYCRIEPSDDARAAHEKLVGKVLTLDRSLEAVLPPLLALVDLPTDDPEWTALDPPQRRRQTLDAMRRLLLRESREQPLLLVFEDLHWIDSESQTLLDELVDALPTARILLLVNYRPEYTHAWGNKSCYTQLRIDPLGQADPGELLAALLGDDPPLQPLKPLLIERTEGNPFFLEESVRELVETGVLAGEHGAYRLTRPAEDARVPATVQAVLAARIDRLPPDDKRLLQTAAVIGKDVPHALLRPIADRTDDDLQRGLTNLQAAEFLYQANLFPELEYTFKHALTHEVAYGSLLQDRRRTLHARIVQTIERLYPERLDEQVERLAHHALAAEDRTSALLYCDQAGDRAMAHAAYREGAVYFERALGAFEHLDSQDGRLAEAIDLRLKLRNAVFSLGDFRGGLPHLLEAERLAEMLGDRRRLAAISTLLASSLVNLGQTEPAYQALQRALAIAADLGDDALRISATAMLAANRIFAGAFGEAVSLLRGNLAAVDGERRFQTFGQVGLPAVTSRSFLAWTLTELGEFDEAMSLTAEAIQIAEEADHPYSMTGSHGEGGYPFLMWGDLAGAIRLLERGVQLAELQDNRAYFAIAAARLGYAYVLSGRREDGLTLLRRATDQFASSGHRGQEAPALIYLAQSYLLNGQMEPALTVAQQALAVAQACEHPPRQADALRLFGEIAAHQESLDADNAECHFREALSMAEELGMRPLQAHCHLGLGKLYRRTGRLDEARTELATAVTMLREMGMAFWLPEAEGELAEAG